MLRLEAVQGGTTNRTQNNQGPTVRCETVSVVADRRGLYDLLTSTAPLLDLDLQTTLVDQVEGFDGVPALYHARDIHFTRALTNHLDVDVPLRERCEHPSSDSHHIFQLSHERQDRHSSFQSDLYQIYLRS